MNRNDDHATQAAAFLREDAPLSPTEQAAEDAMRGHLWILWHAHDPNRAVMLMLSRLGLLRDKAAEAQAQRTALVDAQLRDRTGRADRTAISQLCTLTDEAAGRLEAGEDPLEVAARLRADLALVMAARDRRAAA